MSNPWFRLYSEAVDDEKLRLLAFEDRWHYIALLCCKNNGILDDVSPLMRRKVAVKLGLDLRELDEVARRLSEVGLIDQETFQPIAWDRRQFKSDKDETAAARQKRFRESRKSNALRNGDGNGDVTRPDTDTELDSESEEDTDTEETALCVSPPNSTSAGLCCKAIKDQGISDCNPSHPTLIALVNAGATEEEFIQAAISAASRGKGNFPYVLGTVKRQREQAAKLVLHKGRMPNKQESIAAQNRAVAETWLPPELREKNHAT